MIGIDSLGKNGRIGNQLFQYASLVGIAKNRGFEFCIPDHSNYSLKEEFEDSNGKSIHHQIQKCFKLNHIDKKYGYIDSDILELHQHHFCQELFDECPDNVSLHGYFESYKYFTHVEDELRKDLEFHDNLLGECTTFYFDNKIKNSVSIIIRRGDFLLFPDCHPVCNLDYYSSCINSIGKDRQFVIISDDIEWCKAQKIFEGNNFYFVDSTPKIFLKSVYDMCLSSLSDDFITSNSTFAWWISWLGKNTNKKVYMPDPWFGSKYSDINAEGYYPSYSIKVEREI
jgi:hypothetical protein